MSCKNFNYFKINFFIRIKGTFDQYNLRSIFVDRVLLPYMLANKLKKLLIILDRAPPHKAKSLQKYLALKKITFRMIPSNLTGILQPGDTHWFSNMKK